MTIETNPENIDQEAVDNLAFTRGEFITENYSLLFGEAEPADATRVFTPREITNVLRAYEKRLILKGLINVTKDAKEE